MKIKYLSDSDENYACLEKHLKGGTLGGLPDRGIYEAHKILDEIKEVFEDVASKVGREEISFYDVYPEELVLPTRFESPIQYSILNGLVEKIKKTIKTLGLDAEKFPLYSTIPTGLVNAQAIRLSCSEKNFLLFDSQIFTYCNLFAKAFALCIPILESEDGAYRFSVDPDDVGENIKNNKQCIEKFEELLSVLDETEVPSMVKPYIPGDAHLQLAGLFRIGMEVFLVAHEFGHVFANHLDSFISKSAIDGALGESMSASHLQEYEADSIGLILTLKSRVDDGFDISMSFIGAYLFFVALDLQDRYSFYLERGDLSQYSSQESETHPSNRDRAYFLLELLSQLPIDPDDVESTKHLAKQYLRIVDLVWLELEKRLSNASENS